ncbi:hypothetical protein V8F33_010570 [Rhypophila sp. PSN 637]
MQTDLNKIHAADATDARITYSDLEVSNNPIATHQLVVGYDADGQQIHYYVPISDLIAKQSSFPEVVAAENYHNPTPFVRPPSSEDKILTPHDGKILTYGDDNLPPEVVSSPYDAPNTIAPTICGVGRRIVWVLVTLLLVITAVGGGLGGYFANRSKNEGASASAGSTETTEGSEPQSDLPPKDYEMSLSAVHWVDTGVSNYRVYFQPTYLNETRVLGSFWNSENKTWEVSPITDQDAAIRPNAPIAAVAGIPHTDSWRQFMVNNVYIPSAESTLIERQSPFRRRLGQWGDNDVTYHNVGIGKNSPIAAYWWQDFDLMYMILVIFYQKAGGNTLTMRSYAEAGPDVEDEKKHDWRNVTKSLSIQEGSPLAVAPRSAAPNIMMYMGTENGFLKQVPIDLETDEFGEEAVTNYKLPLNSPLCVSTEDNRNYYTESTLPACVRTNDPLTHLILFATEDHKDLKLLSWNCTSGFIDATSRIQNLLRPNRRYLGVATTSGSNLTFVDQRVYVLYDEGKAEPTLEEWKIPDSGKGGLPDQNGPWTLNAKLPIKPE